MLGVHTGKTMQKPNKNVISNESAKRMLKEASEELQQIRRDYPHTRNPLVKEQQDKLFAKKRQALNLLSL